jgi:glycosyltransferase involved in cell wall biosynthesis
VQVDVGVHVDGELALAHQTLDSLSRCAPWARVFLLVEPDVGDVGPGRAGVTAVRTLRAGGATAFNALLEVASAPLVAFLESGARVTGGALERLAEAVRGGGVGLAGPSTNRAGSEQQRRRDAPWAAADAETLDRYAARLGARLGGVARELAPLHALSGFCLVARREPIATLGGADPAYDPGPLWEADLAVRANRAGWRGLWVAGAYVHRAPVAAWRRDREVEFSLASQRRFQERFCGRFLRGEQPLHRAACAGDSCANFAPRDRLGAITGRPALVTLEPGAVSTEPLVSCILPTRDRPGFVAEALRGFLAQDYPRRELIVVDDGETSVEQLIPVDARIRYLRVSGVRPVGAKRNLACAQARGDVIAHVDDDDLYPPGRLTAQVRALGAGGAPVCGTSRLTFADPIARRAWLYAHAPGRWAAGSTLVYRRSYWQAHQFSAVPVGEDEHFVSRAAAEGALIDVDDPDLCVATVHARNTSPKRASAPRWREIDWDRVEPLLGARAEAYRAAAAGEALPLPLVSCIMPTGGRPDFVRLAVEKFEAQGYPEKELIVLDSGSPPVEHLVRGRAGVRYFFLDRPDTTVGEKRNIACSLARGAVICSWDDDDWYAPDRLRCQVLPIVYGEADMTGLRCDHLLCFPSGEVWSVNDDVHRRMFEGDVAGGTIAFRRDILDHMRFPHINLAEDAALIRMARARGCRLKRIENHGVFAYVRHAWNTWQFEPGKLYGSAGWRRSVLPAGFSTEMLEAHQRAFRAGSRPIDSTGRFC